MESRLALPGSRAAWDRTHSHSFSCSQGRPRCLGQSLFSKLAFFSWAASILGAELISEVRLVFLGSSADWSGLIFRCLVLPVLL